MLSFDEMPDDNADLAAIEVAFPRLATDSVDSCPVTVAEVLEYLGDEVPDGHALSSADLAFVRTAQVADTQYWIWRLTEPDGEAAYATVAVALDGTTTVGYEVDYYGLTPEQYILGDYHNVF